MVENSSLKDEILSNLHFLTIPAILFFSSCVKLQTLQNSSLEKRNIVEPSWKFQPFGSFRLGWNWRRWEFKSFYSSCLKLKTLQNALSSVLDNSSHFVLFRIAWNWRRCRILDLQTKYCRAFLIISFNHFGLFVFVKIKSIVEFLTYRRNFVGCSW